MDVSFNAEVAALRAAASTSTQVREMAQERIVNAFRQFLDGTGTGPTDADLQSFARLALVERALQSHLDRVIASSESFSGVSAS